MVCGIGGFLTLGLSGIVAVILGHIGLSKIKESKGALTGRGLAITGLVTGYLTVLILPVAALAGLAAPLVLRQQATAQRVEMTSNLKQLGLTLLEFDREFGAFPSDATAAGVAQAGGSEAAALTGPDVLGQLEAAGIVDELDDFLEAGSRTEGDWVYFPGHRTMDDSSRVIVVSPLVGDKAVVLRIDQSVSVVPRVEAEALRAESAAVTVPAVRR